IRIHGGSFDVIYLPTCEVRSADVPLLAFFLTADGKSEKCDVSAAHFARWEIYHVKGSPVDPNRLYASQTSGWFGQIIQRSDDGGKTWHQPGTPPGEAPAPGPPKAASNKFVYDSSD